MASLRYEISLRVLKASEILFEYKEKSHISKQPCNVLLFFLYKHQ